MGAAGGTLWGTVLHDLLEYWAVCFMTISGGCLSVNKIHDCTYLVSCLLLLQIYEFWNSLPNSSSPKYLIPMQLINGSTVYQTSYQNSLQASFARLTVDFI